MGKCSKIRILLPIDVWAFLQPLAHSASLDGPLGPGQIDQRNLADLLAAHSANAVRQRLGQDDGEDGVRSGRLIVHVGGSHGSAFIAFNHQIIDLLQNIKDLKFETFDFLNPIYLIWNHCQLRKAVDVGPKYRMLSDFKSLSGGGGGVQEIVNSFVVNFHVRNLDLGLPFSSFDLALKI